MYVKLRIYNIETYAGNTTEDFILHAIYQSALWDNRSCTNEMFTFFNLSGLCFENGFHLKLLS